MKNNEELINQLGLQDKITLEDIPDIDLYMDQVIQLFESKFKMSKRNDDEKVLTKTMINNYAKGKVFFPIKNKKYSKRHLIVISLIYQLKGTLSISDIKTILGPLNTKIVEEDLQLDELYSSFLRLTDHNAHKFKEDILESISEAKEEGAHLGGTLDEFNGDVEYFERLLMIASLSHMSQLYKKAAENLVDEFNSGNKTKS